MSVEVVVETAGPRIHQVLEPLRTHLVLGLHVRRVNEELHSQITPNLILSLSLCESPLRVEEVHLDPVEIILCLCVDHTEDSIRIGFAIYMWDAPVVTDDRDVLSLCFPCCNLDVGLLGCTRQGYQKEGEDTFLHD